mmetsp:Transcript_25906/g.36297  ORF Transcript_25906/g.36297 Transcript_25906/m.36297 type:complete len:144 (+) Transcript_25906:82-513(+)
MGKSEWKEAFSLIDESGIGRIPTKKFGQAVRCAGGYPTEENLKDMIAKADPNDDGYITEDAFMKQMSWIEHANPAFADDVAESFKIFDKDGNGTINKIELHHILTSLGDKMTTEEADEFCREASCDKQGNIDFKQFLREIMDN